MAAARTCTRHRCTPRVRTPDQKDTWLWVKNRYPKWNPGKWQHGTPKSPKALWVCPLSRVFQGKPKGEHPLKHTAMGQNPNPTTKLGSRMDGEFTYPKIHGISGMLAGKKCPMGILLTIHQPVMREPYERNLPDVAHHTL